MTLLPYIKPAILVIVVLCASCSSASQTSPKAIETDDNVDKLTSTKAIEADDSVNKQALTVGIENVEGTELNTAAIRFYVTNNSSDDVRMLVWGTPFEQRLSADILQVSFQGEALPYLGRMVKRGEPVDQDYLLVPAGQRVDALLDISVSYGVSNAGEYNITLNLNEIEGVFMINQETPVDVSNDELVLLVAS